MGFIGIDRRSRPSIVITPSAEALAQIGSAAYGGSSPHPPGLAALPPSELDRYAIAALEAGHYPEIGSREWVSLEGRFLDELLARAQSGGSWTTVGAFCLANNFVVRNGTPDERYLEIVDKACEILRREGVAYVGVPPFALDRWTSIHGWDGAHPAGWPSALEYVSVPSIGHEPAAQELVDGESRRLATRQLAGEKSYFAERRPGEMVVAVVEGVTAETTGVRRWDWEGLSADTYVAFLRELDDRLVTPTEWAHDDLKPYFPCRHRTREEMRRLAAT